MKSLKREKRLLRLVYLLCLLLFTTLGFLQKPFDFSVFIAKIQALLRRTYDFSLNMTLLEYQDMILNHGDCTVSYHDMKVELSKNEMRILPIQSLKST